VSHPQFQSNCTADALDVAAAHLVSGDLVAFPTETVYGLGADACNSKAVARIYEVKGRPADHPLIVHIATMERMGEWAREIPEYAIKLARGFWPGPLTLVLKRSDIAGDFVTGGQDTVGVRVPDHAVALALLTAFEKVGGKGVAAPSANRFGHVSPTNAAAVNEELGQYLSEEDIVLDGGSCLVGVESTIIDCTGLTPRILRPGAISELMVSECTGFSSAEFKPQTTTGEEIRVSGSLENHYAPASKVFLDHTPLPGQGFIADAKIETPEGVIRLASPNDDEEFARLLYAALRAADAKGLAEVVVAQPNGTGIAVAIRDRLARAANGR
jgi:L-threonylcarbamoyladenylate synthase